MRPSAPLLVLLGALVGYVCIAAMLAANAHLRLHSFDAGEWLHGGACAPRQRLVAGCGWRWLG